MVDMATAVRLDLHRCGVSLVVQIPRILERFWSWGGCRMEWSDILKTDIGGSGLSHHL